MRKIGQCFISGTEYYYLILGGREFSKPSLVREHGSAGWSGIRDLSTWEGDDHRDFFGGDGEMGGGWREEKHRESNLLIIIEYEK